ncbi:MAG: glycoside hydrolase family 9 protein [Phormidesmis sp.]
MKIRLNVARLIAIFFTVACICAATGSFWAKDSSVNTPISLASINPVTADNTISDRQPEPARIYAVSPQILAVEVSAPAVILGKQQPYAALPGDRLQSSSARTTVERAGVAIGEKVGSDDQIIFTYDRVRPDSFNLAAADSPASYAISSAQDNRYANPTLPLSVFRKTKPTAFAEVGSQGNFQWPAAHTLFLTLPAPMQPGQTYHLSFPSLGLVENSFSYQPMTARSEAVHVSQLGFRPDDPLKVGYLSTWMGNGGSLDYADGLGFQLINQKTNAPAYSGKALLTRPAKQTEDPRGNDYTLTEVHQLDFSDFKQAGEYRLCVEGVGCSFAFAIAPDTWKQAFFTAVRGFYHQRSGIAIGPPFTSYSRPRAFHPDDGVKVYQADVSLLEVDMGLGSRPTFAALAETKTNQTLSNAWGGYFDAGDWDRRIQHLVVPRGLLELHNLFPAYFKSVNLNLPESNNALPDILDEALWSLDFFRRLQTADGGIRGGIESAEHPQFGEASWQESQTVIAYAPDVWSSYSYAGVAARAAFTLASYDAQLAATYRESALKAMAYGEAHYAEYVAQNYTGELQHNVKDQRNLAALELYRLTQSPRWHDLFLATTVFQDAQSEPFVYGSHEQRDAAFVYAQMNSDAVEKQVQANARASFLRYADALVSLTETTAFGWSKDHPESPLGWANGLGAPKSVNILQAHALTQDPKYLLAGISSTQFSAGANPDNMLFTTGLGDRSPQHPLIIDQRITGQAPPPGITVYGPADLSFYQDYWTIDAIASSTFPPPTQWPTVENYFDVYLYPLGAEFTVDYMLSPAYTWGYLAARSGA